MCVLFQIRIPDLIGIFNMRSDLYINYSKCLYVQELKDPRLGLEGDLGDIVTLSWLTS